MKRAVIAGCVLIAAAIGFAWRQPGRDPLPQLPRVMLWAWERQERMPFIDPKLAGVAFLARTISWRDGVVDSRPRLQPLAVPPETALMALVRLESNGGALPDAATVARDVAEPASLPGVRALQIDFDARQSERQWYGAMLRELRRIVPASTPLSITALASWCQADTWMSGLPVAEAVPMLFRMGPVDAYSGADFRPDLCRASTGISTDEIPSAIPHGRRLYIFNPRSWSREDYRGALQLARRWQ
jgi:hypothetical protein